MQVGQHFYIGISARTNASGAEQLIAILERYGMTGSTVKVTEYLHLKTGITCVAEQTLLAAGEFVSHPEFSDLDDSACRRRRSRSCQLHLYQRQDSHAGGLSEDPAAAGQKQFTDSRSRYFRVRQAGRWTDVPFTAFLEVASAIMRPCQNDASLATFTPPAYNHLCDINLERGNNHE